MKNKTNFFIVLYISLVFFLRVRNVADKRCKKNQITHSVFSIFFPRKSFRF